MLTIDLVRHGQASFGAENYDQLSELGARQCRWLGQHYRQLGKDFDRVMIGTLARHKQSLDAFEEGFGQRFDSVMTEEAFDEYDFHALVLAMEVKRGNVDVKGDDPRKIFFRTLGVALLDWMSGELDEFLQPGEETWSEFEQRLGRAQNHLAQCDGERLLVISSGGLISSLLGHAMECPTPQWFQLNLQMANSAVSRMIKTRSAMRVTGFNYLPHMERSDRLDKITFS